MSILSTNTKLIKVGQEYSAGSGISIDDYVISVTATLTGDYASQSAFDELSDSFSSLSSNINTNSGVWDDVVNKLYISSYHELSAGANTDIQGYVISSRNWTPDITYTSESAYQRATNYTDTQISSLSGEVSAEVSHLSSDIDYISGVALTSHQSLEGYATESFVENVSGDITALIPTNYYPDNNPSGFITGVDLSEYYKKTETSSKEEISAAIAAIPLGDEEVNQVVHTNSSTWNTVSDKLDTTSFSDVSGSFLTAHQSLAGYATTAEVNTVSSLLSAGLDYVSANAGGTGEYVPLDTNGSNVNINLRNKEWQFSGSYSQGKISLGDGSNGAYISYSNTGGHPEYNWTIGGSMGGIGGYHYKLSMLGVSGNDWKFGSAEYNRLVPTSTTADENKILSVNNQGNPEWVTAGGGNPEVENYVQTNSAQIDDTVTSYQTNSGTFLTAHQDLSNYYTTADANTLSSMLSGAIDYVSANAGKVYEGVSPIVVNNTEDKISADTWTFSAGSNVSFVDDNVNKITRIDCTVTGYNETVLYSGAAVSNCTLTEPITNFNSVKYLLYGIEDSNRTRMWFECDTTSDNWNIQYSDGTNYAYTQLVQLSSTNTTLSAIRYKEINYGPYNSTAGSIIQATGAYPAIIKAVVGINRKENA